MRIEYISVGKYRILKNVELTFDHRTGASFLQGIYGNLGISLFAGQNGSGKTSLLSFVAQIFHRLEREPETLPSEFVFEYSFVADDGGNVKCKLSKDENSHCVKLEVENGIKGIIRKNVRGVPILKSGELNYEEITGYLPSNIIVSAFSLHGEYPNPRNNNWIGDRRLDIYDTKNLYGANHFSFPSFSSAIRKLLELKRNNNAAIQTLESLIAGRFTGRVKIAEREVGAEAEWVEFSDEISIQEKNQQIYINDFEMESGSHLLTLANMSSGQKMLFVRLLSILDGIKDNSIVIIEEPEIHLDINWSKQIISVLLGFFSTYRAHLLIATHSYSLLNSVPNNWIFFATHGHFKNPKTSILLGNEASIAHEFFATKPHAVEEQILRFSAKATKRQLEDIFKALGDSGAKYTVFQTLSKKNK